MVCQQGHEMVPVCEYVPDKYGVSYATFRCFRCNEEQNIDYSIYTLFIPNPCRVKQHPNTTFLAHKSLTFSAHNAMYSKSYRGIMHEKHDCIKLRDTFGWETLEYDFF